jgi:carbon-monoxide dehydrogenase small subunit
MQTRLTINGRPITVEAPAETSLVDLLRERLGLTGTATGCDTAQCGACTVLVDGQAVKSCNLLAAQLDGASVRTIESVAPSPDTLHPLQRAFQRHHALQCGFCTPGMVMRGLAMIDEGVPAEPEAIRRALSGNLCRCTGYQGIVDALLEVIGEADTVRLPDPATR